MMICENLTRLYIPFPDSTFCFLTSANNETRMRTHIRKLLAGGNEIYF